MTGDPIDVYRVGIGRDLYLWWKAKSLGSRRNFLYWFRQSWRRRSYWGIWQAEHTTYHVNATRGLTARSARNKMIRSITR